MPVALKDGGRVLDDEGRLILCDDCPCNENVCDNQGNFNLTLSGLGQAYCLSCYLIPGETRSIKITNHNSPDGTYSVSSLPGSNIVYSHGYSEPEFEPNPTYYFRATVYNPAQSFPTPPNCDEVFRAFDVAVIFIRVDIDCDLGWRRGFVSFLREDNIDGGGFGTSYNHIIYKSDETWRPFGTSAANILICGNIEQRSHGATSGGDGLAISSSGTMTVSES